MKIRVRFWSYFKDLTGQAESVMELGENATLGDLWNEVAEKFPSFGPMRRSVLMAVGVEYSTPEYELKPDDEVSFSHQSRGDDAPRGFNRMKRKLVIGPSPIDESALVAKREASSGVGAVVCFSGVVRATEAGDPIDGIEYEAFLEMAKFQFNKLFDEMEKRWPIESIRVIHRIGWVKWGEPSLWVEILAPHRGEGLAACGWLIDQMKEVVPIWKRPRKTATP